MADIRKALVEGTDAAGGFTVPKEYSNRLLAFVNKKSVAIQDMDVRQMGTDVRYIPKVTDGTTAYWVAETAAITEARPSYGQITLTAKKVAALSHISSELLEDNNVDIANHLVEQMGTDVSLAIDNEIYNGTGANFNGLRYTGSFSNAVDGSGNTNATAADGTGSTITGGAIALSYISKAVTEVLKDKHDQPDVSYWNPRTIGSLIQLTDGNARPMLNQETFGSPLLEQGVMYTIYGTKVRSSTQVPVNLTYGTTAALSGACSDALVGVSKMFGILGQRRNFIWKQDYTLSTDHYSYQTTARMAFAIKYADSYCLIRGITD